MIQFKEIIAEILDRGEEKTDRTGVGTLSIFGMSEKWDLREGFPIVTTKKMPFKTIIGELIWFIRGLTDIESLRTITYGKNSQRKTIWDDNCKAESLKQPNRFNGNSMGNMYPLAWRQLPCQPHDYHFIKRKKYNDDYIEKSLDYINPTVEGVGYLGMDKLPDTKTGKILYQKWKDMIIRVHNPRKNHKTYSNIKICKRWYNFKNFYNDAFCLWGFQEFVDSDYQWQLDKDYLGSDIYSPETTIFIPKEINISLNGGGFGFKIYKYMNEVFYSRKDLQQFRGLSRKANLPVDGLEILEDTEKYVVRPIIWIDQLANMIDLIINEPSSRRMVMDSWNPRTTENAILGICHPLVQFNVSGDGEFLDLKFTIRSSDVFLGLPFNITSYATLLSLIAKLTNKTPRFLIFDGGDVHIYKNSIDQCHEILKRKPFKLPKLNINKELKTITDLENLTVDDFELIDYNHHETLTGIMAV